MSRCDIHTTLSPQARKYLQDIQDTHKCNLNVAIEITIDANKDTNRKLKKGILDAVIDEVLNRYMVTNKIEKKYI